MVEVATVVVVHWNQAVRCTRTVEAFLAQDGVAAVLVVDNGSRPEHLEVLRAAAATWGGRVRLLEMGRNLGFGPGANAGLRAWLADAGTDWAVVAPHDALPEPGTVRRLVEAAAARPSAGLVCADVGDGHIPVYDRYFGGMTVPGGGEGGWEDVDYPHGTLLAARRSCLLEVGLFDERYFAYCEEADLGLRARAAGWQVGLVRGARVVNPTMRSGSPVVDYLMQRNTLLLVREHSGRYHAAVRLVIALWQLARGVVSPAPGTFVYSAGGRWRGVLDHLRRRYGPPPADLLRGADEPSPRLDPIR